MSISCKHGQLARSCELCDNEKHLIKLKAINTELLEALKGLLEVADFISENVPGAGWRMAQHKARAAIAKAEGKE